MKLNVSFQPITSSAVYVLGEIISSKMEIAQPLVRIFMHHGQIVPMIKALADAEISMLT
jgi:Ras GTPase-activating protein 3